MREAISDSGAQAHCIPWRVINANRDLIQDIVPAPRQTGLTFGNNQSMETTHMARIGDYLAHATSNEVPDSIIAHAPIVDQGHIIIETKTETIIRDVGEQYELRYPKACNANEWTNPVDTLQQLSEHRRRYPMSADDVDKMSRPFDIANTRAINNIAPAFHLRPAPMHIRSARISRLPKSIYYRVRRRHECMGHAPEDTMCAGLTTQPGYDQPYWTNAGVSAAAFSATSPASSAFSPNGARRVCAAGCVSSNATQRANCALKR
jgi:hypothetical protein